MVLDLNKISKWAILHQRDCGRLPRPYGTRAKPRGKLGKFGGWLEVHCVTQAQHVVQELTPHLPLRYCSNCMTANRSVSETPTAANWFPRTRL